MHDDLINAAAGALVVAFGKGNQVFQELSETVHNLDRFINPADEHHWVEFCNPLKKISVLTYSATTTAFLQIGPILSILQLNAIAPVLLTLP